MLGRKRRVVVIGGGISGLAAAHRIQELGSSSTDVVLLEAGSRLGGVVRSEHRDGFLVEYGPENFITTMPWGINLCERLGFAEQLVRTNAVHRRAFVLHRGKLKPIPSGFAVMVPSRAWPLLSSSILSPLAKCRIICELFVRRPPTDDDESLASFVKRRFGHEIYDRLVQPLIGGIYTANPENLSLLATMPRFREMERQFGSLIRATWVNRRRTAAAAKSASGARYSQFVAPRDGMTSLVDAIANRLPPGTVRLNASVQGLSRRPDGRWSVTFHSGDRQSLVADGLVVALPSRQAGRVLRDVDRGLADELSSIEYGSCALVTFGFRRNQVRHPLDGFGMVVPIVERRKILSATFTSTKYPNRAPDGHVLLRTYLGGACQPSLLDYDDSELTSIALRELTELLGIHGSPVLTHINRQQNAMPQYHVGHVERVRRITALVKTHPNLVLTGNALHGVGIPQCIHSAEQGIEKLLAGFGAPSEIVV